MPGVYAFSTLASQAVSPQTPAFLEDEGKIVRVEANFLRLPLFVLDNKHMRRTDGIRCEGVFRRGKNAYRFRFVATRNASTLYPGPVARSAHLALLSLATARGVPLENPIVFSWRELLARMEVAVSGRTVTEVKRALIAIKGLMIQSEHALYSKADGKPLDTTTHQDQVVGLYEELEFFGTKRADQTIADINAVWLSRWYLDNLNALYSGPLDYDRWRSLNSRSPIASRLYEFLFFKFYGGRESLRFNYPNLVKFIPARRERYLSDARKQLGPAFDYLIDAGILAEVQWSQSREGDPQILLVRGKALSGKATQGPSAFDVGEEEFVLDRIQNVSDPAWQLVTDFHESWGHADFRPSEAELTTARELLSKYGHDRLMQMLPLVIHRMKEKWPDAKTFVAVTRYIAEIAEEYQRLERRADVRRTRSLQEQREQEQGARKAKERATLKIRWDQADPTEQEAIRQAVLARQPASLRKFPQLIERLCLEELAQRQTPDPPSA